MATIPKETVVKLFVKFAKKEHFMDKLYLSRKSIIPQQRTASIGAYAISSMFIDTFDVSTKYFPRERRLALSQLWRFYVLENISLFPKNEQENLRSILSSQIKNNGLRGSEEIEQLFKKYELLETWIRKY